MNAPVSIAQHVQEGLRDVAARHRGTHRPHVFADLLYRRNHTSERSLELRGACRRQHERTSGHALVHNPIFSSTHPAASPDKTAERMRL